MDKNTVIGLLLIFALFMGFSFYQTNRNQKVREAQQKELAEKAVQQIEEEKALSLEQNAVESDTVSVKSTLTAAQQFSNPQVADTSDYIVETAKAYYAFSKKGGYLKRVNLKDIYRYTPKDSAKIMLELFEGGTNAMSINLMLRDQTEISTRDCYFLSQSPDSIVIDEKNKTLSLRLYPNSKGDSAQCEVQDSKSYIEYLYTFSNEDYRFGFKIHFVNMEKYLYPTKQDFTLAWDAEPRLVEKSYESEKMLTSIYYMDNTDEVGNLDERKNDQREFTSALKWVSFKQQFFTTCLISEDQPFTSANLAVSAPNESEKSVLKECKADLDFEITDLNNGSFNMSMYIGPNQYRLLKEYDLNLERQVPLGWGFFLLQWINRFIIIPVFNWLSAYGLNYGLIILLLTIGLKIVLLPVGYKTYMSSAKMRALKPEIEEINARYPKDEDMMKRQQATMSLYRSAGVSPMGGCLPMLLQMPILIAMYRFFPAAYELRQKSFLWAEDLSTYDSVWDFGRNIPLYGDHVSLFTILMTIATLVYTWLNNKLMNPTQGNKDQQRMMNIMMYMMPIMFLFMFNNFSSALTYYYLLFNLLTFAQMFIFRLSVNEEKLHAQLKANMQKPQKKSKWQLKMEEMQKQQAQMMKQQQQQRRK